MKIFILKPLVAVLALGLVTSVSAHHSTSMYDYTMTKTLVGTVRAFQWSNPHAYIQLLVPDGDGRSKEWAVEAGTPASLSAMGWSKQTLKPGDRITMAIAPLRDGGAGGTLKSVTLADGKVLNGMGAVFSGQDKKGELPPGPQLPSLEPAKP